MQVLPQRIQVTIAYADPLIAIGLSAALRQEADFDVVQMEDAAGSDGRSPRPHVVVADYQTGTRRAAAAREQVRSRHVSPPRVLVVTPHDREFHVRSALEAGVDGYLQLGCEVRELVLGVRHLARGSRYLSTTAAQRIAESMARSSLTLREQEVLAQLAMGKSNKVVASDLDISVGTVKAHVKAIMAKLGAGTRTQAASIAAERGLLEHEFA